MKKTKFLTICLTIFCHPFVCLALNCTFDDYNVNFLSGDSKIEAFALWFPQKVGTTITVNELCSNENGLPLRRQCLNKRSNVQTGEWQPISNKSLLLSCNTINTNCWSEPFNHTYLYTGNISKPFQNDWKSAKLWEQAGLKEPCLRDDGMAVTRKCIYDPVQHTAAWEELNETVADITCIRNAKQKVVTYDLNILQLEVSEETINKSSAAKELVNILEKPAKTRVPADIQIIATIVKQLTKDNRDTEILEEIVKIGSNLLETQPKVLEKSDTLNATSNIRLAFETYLIQLSDMLMAPDYCKTNKYGILKAFQHSMSVLLINPLCANISGVALYRKDTSVQNIEMHFDPVTKYQYRFLNMHQSSKELLKDQSVLLAAYFPYSLWSKLLELKGNTKNNMILIYKLDKTDAYFVDKNNKHQIIESPVLNIKIKNFRGDLPENLRFVLPIIENKLHTKSKEKLEPYNKPKCGYWNRTQWTFNGVKTLSGNSLTKTMICSTNHLTNFGISVGIEMRHETDEAVVLSVLLREQVLDVITVSGCCLSLFGLLAIWLTGLFFKSWRSKESHQVVMNMCVALTLIYLFFLMVNVKPWRDAIIDPQSDTHCLAMAAFLQYIILVLFTWMLIVAYLQYQRYVIVIGMKRPERYILKSAIAAWTIPLLPTVLVALLAPPKRYETSDEFEICYPTENALYFGVIMPISATVVVNLGIFIYILGSISQTVRKSYRSIDRNLIIKQIYLSILFFFLFGLSWLFGIFAHLNDMWSYLFCFTSTLQGFVLFVYFVAINDTARMAWTNCLCFVSDKKKYSLQPQSLGTTSNSSTTKSTSNRRSVSSKYSSDVTVPTCQSDLK